MSAEIRIYLLNNSPRVELRGDEIHVPDSSLDLLIYLAIENQPIHDRDVLTRRLYETTLRRDSLRQSALGNLNKEIKELCIRPSPPNTVGYDNTHVWMDIHEFSRLVRNPPDSDLLTDNDQSYAQLLAAYELYQQHFLEDYTPTLYGLTSWIQEQRRSLRELFHGLLEKLVQYEITEEMYAQALLHAERWHRSLPDSELPLQYLIWLTANMDAHSHTLNYLHKLEALDLNELRIIGYSPQEWRRRLDRRIKPEIEDLKLSEVARIEISELLSIASNDLIGRTGELEEILGTLFVTEKHRLSTVTGARGIGKTVLAEAVGRACEQVGLVERVIQVGVTTETDFNQVLDTIALQIEMPQLMDLDYRNKYVSIEQIFEGETSLLILDQQETANVFTDEFIARVRALSEQVKIIVCGLEPWADVYDIHLDALEQDAVTSLVYTYSGNRSGTMADIDTLRALTQGTPLALKLFASVMNSYNLSLTDALAQVDGLSTDVDAELLSSQHGQILLWCWHLLDEPGRCILASLMTFDLLEGPGLELLYALHSNLSKTVFEVVLERLENMSLIELREEQEAQPVYRWHSLLHEFLRSIDALARASNDPLFKSAYLERFCRLHLNYLAQHAEEYPQLDLRQRTLLHAVDLGFDNGSINLDQVNLFLPYLLARGLYEAARQLINRAEQLARDAALTDCIELLLNSGKLYIKLGEFETAEQKLKDSLALAEQLGSTKHQGEIYNQRSIIAKTQGQYAQSNEMLEVALQYARSSQNTRLICTTLANLGATACEHGEYEEAKGYLEESLRFAEMIQDQYVIVYTFTYLAIIAGEQFDFQLELDYLAEAQATAQQIANPERQAYIYINTSAAYFYLQQYQDARAALENGLDIAQRLRHEELVANCTRMIGRIEAVQGNLLVAEGLCKQALMAALDRDFSWLAADVLLDIGKMSLLAHREDYTRHCFQEALDQALELSNYDLVAEALLGLAMNTATETWIVGPDDSKKTAQAIQASWDTALLTQLPGLPISRGQLDKAEFLFQHGLVNFPDLQRYRVTEALAQLIGIDQAD